MFHLTFITYFFCLSIHTSISTSAWLPACAEVASCQIRSISLCSSLSHGLPLPHFLTHTHKHTARRTHKYIPIKSHSHAYLHLPLPQRSTAPDGHMLPVISHKHLWALFLAPQCNAQLLSLSSCWQLCHLSWGSKGSNSHTVMYDALSDVSHHLCMFCAAVMLFSQRPCDSGLSKS